jgi:hypothetical protein
MKVRGCSHVKNARQKEDTVGKHCPNLEADRGRYAAKGVQSWVIARLAFVIRQAPATPANSSPATLRGFSLTLAYFGRRYVNLLRMAGFAWHIYPETASKPHLSNEVGGAIILASQRMECFVTEFLKITECTRSEQMTILPFLTLVSNQFAQIDRLFLAHPEVLTVDEMF